MREEKNKNKLLIAIGCMVVVVVGARFGLTAIQEAREAARREQCKENLKQIQLAMEKQQKEWSPSPVARISLANVLTVIRSKQFDARNR